MTHCEPPMCSVGISQVKLIHLADTLYDIPAQDRVFVDPDPAGLSKVCVADNHDSRNRRAGVIHGHTLRRQSQGRGLVPVSHGELEWSLPCLIQGVLQRQVQTAVSWFDVLAIPARRLPVTVAGVLLEQIPEAYPVEAVQDVGEVA